MRSIFVLALLLSFKYTLAQQGSSPECDALLKTELDSLSGEYSRGTRQDIVISKDGKDVLSVSFLVMDRTIIVSFTAVGGVYCIDETNKVNILFRDGTSIEMANNAKFNCDGDFSLFFYGAFGNRKQYDQIMTKEIGKIKVGLRKSVVDRNRLNFIEASIPEDKSKVIRQVAECLLE